MARAGILFILVGPSGAGKNTLIQRVQLRVNGLPQLATATTRDMRAGEAEGREHVFVSREQFQTLIDSDALLEYQPVHAGDLYGTPRASVERALEAGDDLIADIEFLGAEAIDDAYPDHTVLVFVTPSNLDILAERIQQRGPISPTGLADRLARARFESTFARRCDYVILNDMIEPAAEHLRQVIVTERARRRSESVTDRELVDRPAMHVAVGALFQRDGCLLARRGAHGYELPIFAVDDVDHLPHETLQKRLRALMAHEPQLEAVLDGRFDFVPPFHVAVSVIPHDVYLYYYYRCRLPSTSPDGWEWRPASDLSLPPALARLVPDGSGCG